ncbi:transcriptional regulator with PAS, ATPase and Fis domain [Geomicrobium halophilum]|uniref:Transcriptional regulator with PAS, ATPase and Fis domain n=1 Tax=Geomicrobium halophilum TaxID=549000 RepID=A0A841PX95_9BACL|nr:sigma-54-dependent Fis family transcriptional regulator [Geomicrobium halophilum]MBB6448712.1 transcriptional regulator with PAS, ATPase and Fis domain [Geomicrobium halophilum]
MPIKIGIIAPYPGLKTLAENMAKEYLDFEATVQEADLHEGIPVVQRFEKEGYEIIISRGGTANIVRQHTSLPVVEIDVSGYDIMRTLMLIKDYQWQVEMVGFPNVCQGVIEVSRLMNIDIPYTVIYEPGEVGGAVIRAKEKGASVIIGDTIAMKQAEIHGLQSVMITSGRESVTSAFQQVRQMYEMKQRRLEQERAYQSLLENVEDGVVLFNQDHRIIYQNKAFSLLWGGVEKPEWLGECDDQLTKWAYEVKQRSGCLYEHMQMGGSTAEIEGGFFRDNNFSTQYYFRMSMKHYANQEVEVRPLESSIYSFSQMSGDHPALRTAIQQGQIYSQNKKPIAIYGESGTGKKVLSSAIHYCSFLKEEPVYWVIFHEDGRSVRSRWTTLMNEKGTLIVQGLENLSYEHQQYCFDGLEKFAGRCIFLFSQSPETLVNNQKLHHHCYDHLKDQVIHLPPLRERMDDLEDYIRSFIAQSNVKYGKQMVGVIPSVLGYLHQQEWPENIKQLEETIAQLVKHSTEPYIEEDVLENISGDVEQKLAIDLNQSLANIEQQVIRKVLQEEDNNQTKAARRLGINRSTLWRKLK